MAPAEIDSIPRDIVAPVKNMKVVDKVFELPLVASAYDEIVKLASPVTPIVEFSLSTITPMVEVGIGTIKTKVEESVIPCLPAGMSDIIQANMNIAVEHVTAAVNKIDTLACGGIDQLTEKVPQLTESTPKLIANTKETATGYIRYVVSFFLAMFKFATAGLDIVEGVVRKTGGTEEGFILSTIKKLRATFGYLGFKKSDAIVTEEVCVDEVAKDIITDEAVADVVTDEEDLNEM